MLHSNTQAVTDSDFEEVVLRSEVPVLVDYWAEWCGPCKMIAPVVEEVAGDYKNRLKVCKMDVDNNTETPQKYGIRGIPTLILFKNGEQVGQHVGALSRKQLGEFVDAHIG